MIKLTDLVSQRNALMEVMVETEPTRGDDGTISAQDLHKHFDVNGDGKVDMIDYAAHVIFHLENPQFLAKYRAAAQDRLVNSAMAEKMGKFVQRGYSFPVEN